MGQFEEIMNDWNKQSKALIAVQGLEREQLPRIPFSAPIMNYQTYGGIPRKRVIEFFGPESSGKTTSALDIVGNAQRLFQQEWEYLIEDTKQALEEATANKAGKTEINRLNQILTDNPRSKLVVYMDLENTLDAEWAEKLGVDTNDWWIVKPELDSAEEILQRVIDMFNTGEVGLIVLDSLPYMVSQNLMDEDLTKKAYAGISAPLTEFSRKVQPVLTRNNATFLGINQIREDLASQYNAYTTPGGKMWKHACSVRIKFRKGDFFDERGGALTRNAINPAGNFVESFIEKTKAFKPNRKLVKYALSYMDGILVEDDLVDVSVEYGFVNKGGAWYTVLNPETGEIAQDSEGNDYKFQGKARIVDALRKDDDLFNSLMERVHEKVTAE